MDDETHRKVLEPSFYHTKIKDWPSQERPREKFITQGAEALSEAELLAILIGSGSGKVTALDLAKTLFVEHQTLRSLAGLSVADLKKFKGIGDARAVCIAASYYREWRNKVLFST